MKNSERTEGKRGAPTQYYQGVPKKVASERINPLKVVSFFITLLRDYMHGTINTQAM